MVFENEETKRKFLGFLGLCKRAGRVICGTPMVCGALAESKKPPLVLYSLGASASSQKKVVCKCDFYGVHAVGLEISPEELGHAVGKTGAMAALAVTDAGFAEAMVKKLFPENDKTASATN
ncbi:MAG: ribosomal L7Ae/L30e/S12e/Gadd45 family protein [Clostridia bacterium]|nr:ribosomal L7Ae/L30e/S12e/Gadd45 family protein [Clostridia bacterium]